MRSRRETPNGKCDPEKLAGFGDRLRQAFGGKKQVEIARDLGVTESAVRNYLAGRIPPAEMLVQICALTNRSIDWLLTGREITAVTAENALLTEAEELAVQELANEAGEEFAVTLRRLLRDRLRSLGRLPPEAEPLHVDYYGADWTDVPLLGQVAAGSPIEQLEHRENARVIRTWPESKKAYALRVTGDSMEDAGIHSGDLIVCLEAAEARRGQLVVALIDGERATVKRFFRDNGTVMLKSEDSTHEPQSYDASRVRIQGRVESIIRSPERIKVAGVK